MPTLFKTSGAATTTKRKTLTRKKKKEERTKCQYGTGRDETNTQKKERGKEKEQKLNQAKPSQG